MDKKNSQFAVSGADELLQQALEAVERVEKSQSEEDIDIGGLDEAFAAAAPTEAQAPSTPTPASTPAPKSSQDTIPRSEVAVEQLEQATEALEQTSNELEKAHKEIASLEAQVMRLEEALQRSEQSRQDIDQDRQEHYERLLRLSADFDNLRKRASREKADLKKFGGESVMRDLLDVVDNFDRALESLGEVPDSVREGLSMVHRQLHDAMKKNGVEQFSAKGEPFDYTLHEAISVVESDEMPPNFVMEQFQSGYMFHDRLLRAARVVVTKAPSAPAPPPEEPVVTEDPENTGEDIAAQSDSALSSNAELANAKETDSEGFDPNDIMEEEVVQNPSGE